MPTLSGKKRRPRLTPQYPNLELILGEKDLRLLHLLYTYRVLNTEQIKTLMPDWSDSALNKRLTDLYHHGYCDRPQYQLFLQIANRQSWQMIYAPTRKGIKAIGIDSKTDYNSKNDRLSPSFMNHRMGINQTKIVLQTALEEHESIQIAWWLFDKQWASKVTIPDREERGKFNLFPDSFFALYDKSRQSYAYFFLEIDNGNEDHAELIYKLKRYGALAKSGQLIAPQPPSKPIHAFRVLFAMNSEKRLTNLFQRVEQVELAKRHWFYFTTQDQITLENPTNVFQPIWKVLKPTSDAQGKPRLPFNGQLEYMSKSILY